MIWILLLYVLPLVLGIASAYYIMKRNEEPIGEFIKLIVLLIIPPINIIFTIAAICVIISDWIETNESIQDFLNRKL
jgi:fructose-specific phosphotransferase system IIC component